MNRYPFCTGNSELFLQNESLKLYHLIRIFKTGKPVGDQAYINSCKGQLVSQRLKPDLRSVNVRDLDKPSWAHFRWPKDRKKMKTNCTSNSAELGLLRVV